MRGGTVIRAAVDFLQVRQVCQVRTESNGGNDCFLPLGDKHWGMVVGHGEGLYETIRRSWSCVMHVKVACVIPQEMADVQCASGGYDSGARPTYVSSDWTYGTSLLAFGTVCIPSCHFTASAAVICIVFPACF